MHGNTVHQMCHHYLRNKINSAKEFAKRLRLLVVLPILKRKKNVIEMMRDNFGGKTEILQKIGSTIMISKETLGEI